MKRLALGLAIWALVAAPTMAEDIAAGETVFNKCKACHAVGEGAKNRVGPQLNDLFGRTAGTLADYKYSKPMVEAGEAGLVWTPETLREYLVKPRDFVKGTRMAFAGLPNPVDIDNLVAYLATFSPPPPAQ
jgi:cytochrome c2